MVKIKQKKAKIDGSFFVHQDGKKTHLRHIVYAIARNLKLPSGFYLAVESSDNSNMKHLANIAQDRGLQEA